MANGPLRSFLRPSQDPYGSEEHEDYLDQLIKRERAQMPMGLPPQREVPASRKLGIADFLAQALGGVGDAFSAKAGRRTDTVGRVMSLQHGIRQQEQAEAMAQAAAQYEADRMAYEDQWRRYGAEQSNFGREFDRAMKMRELKTYKDMMDAQQSQAKQKKENYARVLGEAARTEFGQADDVEALKTLYAKKLMDSQGDPDLEPMIREAQQKRLQEIIRSQKPGAFQKGLMELDQLNFLAPTERGTMKRYPYGKSQQQATPWWLSPQGFQPAPMEYGYRD